MEAHFEEDLDRILDTRPHRHHHCAGRLTLSGVMG